MSDIHIRDWSTDVEKEYESIIMWFPTLCGDTVMEWNLVSALDPELEEPTCLGCILVNLANKAEDV